MAMEFPKTIRVASIINKEEYFKWMLLIPLLIVLGVFAFYPLFYCVYISFHLYSLRKAPVFIGLSQYRKILSDPLFWKAISRTFYIMGVCITVELSIGLLIALLLNREFKGQNTIRGLCLMPLLISPLSMSMIWNYMLHYQVGIVNKVLSFFGLPKIGWFATPEIAIYSITLITIWQWTPFSIFVFLAVLRGMPKDMFEAAQVDGAPRWFTFRKLTLPMLKPFIVIVILLRVMWLIRLYDPLFGTTHGGLKTETIDWMLYRVSFVYFNIGEGATIGMISLYITIILCALLFRQLIKALKALG